MRKTTKLLLSIGVLIGTIILYQAGPYILSTAGLTPASPYYAQFLIGLLLLIWISGVVVICILIRVLIWDGLVKRATGLSSSGLIKQLSDFTIILIAVPLAAKVIFDQNVIAFVTALGAVGVVLSFGIKELISDLMTGLAVNLEHSFTIGDWISIHDGQAGQIFGRVTQIHWRTTHLVDENQSYFIVPNREIGNSTITVYSNPTPHYRFAVPVELDYTVEAADAKRILFAAAMAVTQNPTFVRAPKPSIVIENFLASGVGYSVRFCLDMSDDVSVVNAKSLVLESIFRHLRLEGLSPSFSKLESYPSEFPDLLAVRPPPDPAKVLANISFLKLLTDTERDYISKHGRISLWKPQQTIIEKGDAGESMFVVLEGVLEVFGNSENGVRIRVGQIQAGEIFGEMSLLTGEPRNATIIAIGPVRTLEITKGEFAKILQARPEICETLADIMSERQRDSESALSDEETEAQRQHIAKQVYSKVQAFFGISK